MTASESSIPRDRKSIIKQNITFYDLLVPDHYLIYRNRLGNVEKISSKEPYGISTSKSSHP